MYLMLNLPVEVDAARYEKISVYPELIVPCGVEALIDRRFYQRIG